MKTIGYVIGFILLIIASFAIDGLLQMLSDVPVIGILAKWILHMRDTVY